MTAREQRTDVPGVAPAEYRDALGRHPAGVTVVTMSSPDGPVGFTATSFASLSLDPPLVSFNIARTSSSYAAAQQADTMVVHLLGEHQRAVATRFSRAASERFADTAMWETLDSGEPHVLGAPTWMRVRIDQRIDIGDHTLVIARVLSIHAEPDADDTAPLLYHRGAYHRPEEL
nr:flavin reductase family protein [Rhodococcus rhodnii]